MAYVPVQGDVVWINFDPQAGHEQGGRRPALVLSSSAYNRRVGLALFCPITSHVKGYPFEVLIPQGHAVKGALLADQSKKHGLDCEKHAVSLHPAHFRIDRCIGQNHCFDAGLILFPADRPGLTPA